MYGEENQESPRKPIDAPTAEEIVGYVNTRLGGPESEHGKKFGAAVETIRSYCEGYDKHGIGYTPSRNAVRAGVEIIGYLLTEVIALHDEVQALKGNSLPDQLAPASEGPVGKLQKAVDNLRKRVSSLAPKKAKRKGDRLKTSKKVASKRNPHSSFVG